MRISKKKSNRHFIPIQGAFLFDTFKLFKSTYSVWVYIYLKLNNYGTMIFHPETEIFISGSAIAKVFDVGRSTIYRALYELEKYNLIINNEKGSKWRILQENELISVLRDEGTEHFYTKNSFFEIYNNFFMEALDILEQDLNSLKLYYYLKFQNQHYINNKIDQVKFENKIATRYICNQLSFSHHSLRKSINKLIENGFIIMDDKKYIHTFSEKKILKNVAHMGQVVAHMGKVEAPVGQVVADMGLISL